MVTRAEVLVAVRVLDEFIAELGDSPMGGQSLVSREWDRARQWLMFELDCRGVSESAHQESKNE
jgi:hypothetical protein